ncbi:uncharacterized protein BCR38DRAFT_400290 [Pseudomassariella vexata]|uniref:T6SS Phospholipase effector Tle1-like catalytic domain-containing protein n=1 Tax=Pseudomassariella vexata TaxID=1141098 RepID=A0A1Y2DH08_9PEZI|nr:uncharacterized protein BCR38DRAFT_400290 [Pseudomassariella vexata]ORY58532.1 hypothetical protein BCR38DRAFT_400290 [Pseudomassariella vexata]
MEGTEKIKRKGLYPIQTPGFIPYPEPPPETKSEEQIRLPSSIRALKDSHQSGHHPRTLVICLDGTGDQFDNDNSNIVSFVSCLKKHSPAEQVTYYQSGIGTYDKGGLKNGIGAAMDMAVGSGLGIHIKDAYRFLMQNYHEGDKICLLGFSRGAYTVRCLAGMLHKVGLLPASNGSQINFAYDFYKDDSKEGCQLASDFKTTFCTHVSVYFVGVFDCVASVGFIPRKMPLSKSPTNSIRHFRHAMALDEHRAKFKVCHWQQHDPDDTPGLPKRRGTIDFTPFDRLKRSGIATRFRRKPNTAANANGVGKPNSRHREFRTDALEVWFRGAHADVGGGAVKNESRHMLSRIPLRWMLRQCFNCNTGILFDTCRLADHGLDVHTLWPVYQPRAKPTVGPPPALLEKYEKKSLAPLRQRSTFLPIGPEEYGIEGAPSAEDLQYVLPSESTEDHFDCMEEPRDQLVDAKSWWMLEIWPVKIHVLASDGEGWEKRVRMNLGRHRAIRELQPKLHWTVQHRINERTYDLKTRAVKNTSWLEVV